MSSAVIERDIARVRDGREASAHDRLAVEAPLEIRVGGKPLTVVMRTPGHDEELARGFLFTEGIVSSTSDVLSLKSMAPDATELPFSAVVDVQLAPPPLTIGGGLTLGKSRSPSSERNFFASSSCGVCGKTSIAQLQIVAPVVQSNLRLPRQVLYALPDRLRAAQAVFAETGGLHASGLFDGDGALLASREDVGRHNALDKLIGWALVENRLPLSSSLLMVSGRVSYEILQKAIMAGIPVVAAVSAPSSLAVELAERFGVTLVGFLRGSSMNVYTHGQRLI